MEDNMRTAFVSILLVMGAFQALNFALKWTGNPPMYDQNLSTIFSMAIFSSAVYVVLTARRERKAAAGSPE